MKIYSFFVLLVVCVMLEHGCRDNPMVYKIGLISFNLPDGYKEVSKRREDIPSRIPGEPSTTERVLSFEGPYGETVYVWYWEGFPWRDYGPMSEKKSYSVSLLNRPAKVIRTKIFMGTEQTVWVVHCELSENDRLMVYTPNMTLDEFKKFLKIFKTTRD